MSYQIPFTGLKRQYKQLREEILDVTDSVLSSGQYMNGPYTQQFEQWLANQNNTLFSLTCHSGTQALEVIASYWKDRYDQDPVVLVPNLTFIATANAFVKAGWRLYFVDTDVNGLIDVNKIPDDLDYQAVVLVGLYGADISQVIPSDVWSKWLYKQTVVIEDAAQNWLGAEPETRRRIGVASAISFDPMKNLACYGNGGAIVSNDEHFFNYAKSWRDHGKYTNLPGATNSRMSEVDCATMMVKTKYVHQWQERRKQIAEFMRDQLVNSPIRCLFNSETSTNHAYHKFVIELSHRRDIQEKLLSDGIETKVHYDFAINATESMYSWPGPNMLSVSTALSRRVLSLPLYPELTDSEIEFIVNRVLAHVS